MFTRARNSGSEARSAKPVPGTRRSGKAGSPSSARRRWGVATLEFALVAPVFLALMLGILEFGRVWMVQNSLTHATREGARRAILRGTTSDAPVKQAIRDQLQRMQVNPQAATIMVYPSNLGGMKRGDTFFILVQVDMAAVTWIPRENSLFLRAILTGQRE